MINWATDVLARGLADSTDAEIQAALAASPVTARPLSVADLRAYLRDTVYGGRRLLRAGVRGGWEGVLADAAENASLPAQLRDGIGDLLSKLSDPDPDATFRSDQADDPFQTAARMAALMGGLVATGVIEAATHRAAVYSLAGGLKYAGVTDADVAAARDAEARRIRSQVLKDQLQAAYNAAVALVESYGRGERDEPTADELAGV